tara:strand:+ start:882 stop:1166 length:285 start_codon:yes stop_codon:yes gene_type:complete
MATDPKREEEYHRHLEEDHRLAQDLFGDDPVFLEERYSRCLEQIGKEKLKSYTDLKKSIESRLIKAADMSRTIKSRWHHTQVVKLEIESLEKVK